MNIELKLWLDYYESFIFIDGLIWEKYRQYKGLSKNIKGFEMAENDNTSTNITVNNSVHCGLATCE